MKNFIKLLSILLISFFVVSCVQDDKFDAPNTENYQCAELTPTKTIAQVKTAYTQNTTITADDVLVGYVSSTDESGNIYKTIYIQDAPENPTQGLTISVDANSTYTRYPQGSKIFIKMKGLAMGTYGNLIQVGAMQPDGTFGRIPATMIAANIVRSCAAPVKIVPKVMTFAQLTAGSAATTDPLIGALIQINNVEFENKSLCTPFAPDGESVDKYLRDGSSGRVVRNSGFASFANQKLPSGNGTFVGILSKYNSTYQLYINRVEDLNMTKFPRLDGITADPCTLDANLSTKTVAQVKQMFTGSLTKFTDDIVLKAKVTANDETGNLYKYIYVEDATGGIRVNINKLDLYLDPRFKVGKELWIRLKDMYINRVSGELQLGGLFNGALGQVDEVNVYKHFFDSNLPVTAVVPTVKTISELTPDDVGKWIKIKDVQFATADLGRAYALSNTTTNRTLEDCNGKTIILRTSNFATFAPYEVDGGKGDVSAILSIFNGTYQLWIPYMANADLDNPRCDGTVPEQIKFQETFDVSPNDPASKWIVKNISGTTTWTQANYGVPRPCAIITGSGTSEDWLITKPISLAGLTTASLTFMNDVRNAGSTLKVMISENYSGGDPNAATWTTLTPYLDTNTSTNNWVYSDKQNISQFAGKTISLAFKYTSAGTQTWEIDNVTIKGK